MLFRSKLFDHWDTWMYYHEGRYYLYYLINNGIGRTNWDGFGVAVSEDGVHYEDQGRVLIQSEKNTCFLGTGAVWKAPDFEASHKFICNYSEHRQTEKGEQQTILFATSTDLVHWDKLGDDKAFSVDERYYVDAGVNCRWDCIYPLEKENGGYYGYFTANPIDCVGVGIGESEDGIHWRALAPVQVNLEPHYVGRLDIEAGAIACHKGIYYLMIGNYTKGMALCTSDSPLGPFSLMKKNWYLLPRTFTQDGESGQLHAYFPRFFSDGNNLLVNFHVLLREKDQNGMDRTYMAPLKKVLFDEEGILRLHWWENNDILLGDISAESMETWMSDVSYRCGEVLQFHLEGGMSFLLLLDRNGKCRLWDNEGIELKVDRSMSLAETCTLRVLVRGSLSEMYADGEYLCSYTAKGQILSASADGHGIVRRKLLLP